ncbi:hypothetical protein ISF08_19990 [Pseudomonas aeruginosa]|uniref:hypothetical protein n=1 Tax=Pseudomonas TaxID=286 RepID=UPI00053D8054|nr:MULTISPECIES: hypothetical protein [Pseudomonas]AVR82865.1 tail length tape measure protein [Pseudomonas aeruginosa]AVR86606.1 tail length tape measure protein [Pseudomonas aeruginosa]EIU2834172.1 hypothetical protein [Pseudomonas aeruginosa]EIU2869356.1 hypothetical protein [Pseudomonas aeruginosa]EJT5136768.1 hypothetical protein [Pseudomonas aeruginosa]
MGDVNSSAEKIRLETSALPAMLRNLGVCFFLSATLKNDMTFNLIDDPERIAAAYTPIAGQEAFTVMLSRDPARWRSVLGIS